MSAEATAKVLGLADAEQAEYAAAHDHDHEAFLDDKYDVTGVDLDPAPVAHIAPAGDRPAHCLEVTGQHWTRAIVLANTQPPACRECLEIAEVLDTIELYDLARLAAGVAADVPVVAFAWRLDTEALPMRDLSTRDVVAVRLLCDPAAPLSVLKADLWQEIRSERPHLYPALCARDVAGAYAAALEADR